MRPEASTGACHGDAVWPDALSDGYDAWAPRYDADMQQYGYRLPSMMLHQVRRYILDCRAFLLDVGAGSGLLGQELRAFGYRNLVGIDPSMGMLRQARAKEVYRMGLQMVLGAPTAFADHMFDGILAAGVFKPGHAPPEALEELTRISRPGGIIVYNLEAGAEQAEDYDRIRRRLETRTQWRPVASTAPFAPLPGAAPEYKTVIYVYQTEAQPARRPAGRNHHIPISNQGTRAYGLCDR
ncbi:MAG: class I SAM-dependent methyltransferase [Desulfosarcina sp.]|nr:class I SAM-dependent methyltransferase [Desulfobacterales bacterium]